MKSFLHSSIILLLTAILFLSGTFSYAQKGAQFQGNDQNMTDPDSGAQHYQKGKGGFADPDSCRCPGIWWEDNLTGEQKAELRVTIRALRDEGKTRDEIHAAVIVLYEKWGLEPPDFPDRDCAKLTTEQRQELREMIKSLRDQGKTAKEIRQATIDLLQKWGVQPPVCRPHVRRGIRRWLRSQLSEEQKQILKDTMQKLREQNASREEIHKAIMHLMRQWGIEPPDAPGWREGKGARQHDRQQSPLRVSNHPNPFNPSTTITYRIEEPNWVTLSIYNIQGQLICSLVDGFHQDGDYSVLWNGNDASGRKAASGLYLYTIKVGDIQISREMMLTK